MADPRELTQDLRDAGQQAAGGVQAGVERGVRRAAPGLEALARFGYVSKGVVYATVGLLALALAFGRGGQATDAQGALRRLGDLPLGSALIWPLALGLFGYALWQLLRALLDPEGLGQEAKALAKRAAYLLSALINFALFWFAVRLAGEGRVGGGAGEAAAAREVLSLPAGQLWLGLAGVLLLGAGAAQVIEAVRGTFMRRVVLRDAAGRHAGKIRRIGQLGLGARGVTFAALGAFLLTAAAADEARRVRDSSGLLTWLRDQPAGEWLLALSALGTFCYGLWCFVQARYRRIGLAEGG